MKFLCTFISTLAVGTLVMYWPIAVMGVILMIALVGAALERKPVEPEANEHVPGRVLPFAQQKTEAAGQSKFLKAA